MPSFVTMAETLPNVHIKHCTYLLWVMNGSGSHLYVHRTEKHLSLLPHCHTFFLTKQCAWVSNWCMGHIFERPSSINQLDSMYQVLPFLDALRSTWSLLMELLSNVCTFMCWRSCVIAVGQSYCVNMARRGRCQEHMGVPSQGLPPACYRHPIWIGYIWKLNPHIVLRGSCPHIEICPCISYVMVTLSPNMLPGGRRHWDSMLSLYAYWCSLCTVQSTFVIKAELAAYVPHILLVFVSVKCTSHFDSIVVP